MRRQHSTILAASFAGALAASVWAAAPDTKEAFLDPGKAGTNFEVQGEYLGRGGTQKLGAQVIALGEGKFRAVFLPGGLPGEGWDGKTHIPVDGQIVGDLTQFGADRVPSGRGWNGRIGNGRFVGRTDEGVKFTLKKVLRKSPTEGKKPPRGALVLFDGRSADAWLNGRITPEGWLQEGTQTRQNFKDFTLHIEFMTSFMPAARGQGRANSGVFLDGRYEIQILDSFGLEGKNNECGAIYSLRAPDVNMCYPPLSWQTYDIEFRAPEFDAGGRKTRNALVTVRHNGVLVHDHQEIAAHTGHGKEGPELGPIVCMNHGNPIRFRNIWVVEKK